MGTKKNNHSHGIADFLICSLTCSRQAFFKRGIPAKQCSVLWICWLNVSRTPPFQGRYPWKEMMKISESENKPYQNVFLFSWVDRINDYSNQSAVSNIYWCMVDLLLKPIEIKYPYGNEYSTNATRLKQSSFNLNL